MYVFPRLRTVTMSFFLVALQPNEGYGLLIHEVFLDHTQRRTTVCRTPLDEWSASHRDLYLTTHNTHNRQISMPPLGFEPTISAGERPQTYALDRAATGTDIVILLCVRKVIWKLHFVTMFMKSLTWIFSVQQTSATPNRVQQKPRETIFLPATVPDFLCLSSGSQRSGLFTCLHEQSQQLASRFCSCHVVTIMGSIKIVISSVHIEKAA